MTQITFQLLLQVLHNATLFANQHCVHNIGILTVDRQRVLVQVPSCLTNYDGSRLLFSLTPFKFAYQCSLVLRESRRRLLFRTAVVENSNALLPFFTLALIGGSVDYVLVFESGSTFAELDVPFSLPRGVHALLSDIGLYPSFKIVSMIMCRRAWLIIVVSNCTGTIRRAFGASHMCVRGVTHWPFRLRKLIQPRGRRYCPSRAMELVFSQ